MVAIDLGAQSGRVAVGRFDGEQLSLAEVHRFANVPVRTLGRLNWDILRLYDGVLEGLRAAGHDAGHVDSVGVDSWAIDFGLLDRDGVLVQNPVHYRDGRRAAAVDRVLARVPPRELYERTGIQLMPINTVFELAAMADGDDPALEIANALLLVPDLFHYWLGAARVAERTNATTTQCLDARSGGWAYDLLDRLDVPARLFPEIVAPATVVGTVSTEVADATGLAGAHIVAGATHDTAAAVAAVPLTRPDSAYVSAGTWSLVGVEAQRPTIDDRTFAANLTNEGGVAETFRLLRNVAGLWLLHECRRAWSAEGRDYTYEELVQLALRAPPLRSLVNPDDQRFAEPGDMPSRVREACAQSGEEVPEQPGEMVRCILESLALGHAHAIDLVRGATGMEPAEVHVVGGGAGNELLCRWTASAAGLPVLAGPVEATTIGNLMVQAIALGEIASLHDAREVVRASVAPTLYEPEDAAAWEDARERFQRLATAPAREEVEA